MSLSVIVVGAGVFGVTGALELRRRGHEVTLLDPGPLPHPLASSTDLSKMIRMDYGADEFYMALMERAFEGWRAWNRLWAEDLYHETGFLILAGGPLRPGTFEGDSLALLRQRGHPVERLTSVEVRRRFPAWRAEAYPEGYFNPLAGWAESGRVVARLVRMAQEAGVGLRQGEGMARLLESEGRVRGVVTTSGDRLGAEVVVVAAGAWTPKLLPHLADRMWPVGQPVLHFRVPDPEAYQPPRFPPWAADVANTGWYGFPALPDGTLKIANHGPGVPIDPDAPRQVPPGTEAKFRAFLSQALPGLAEAPLIGGRLCLYCDTWDGDFYIDRDPERPGLVVASGGSGHGFKFAPLLGPLIADAVEGRPNPDLKRFAWRARASRRTEQARYSGGPGQPSAG